MNVYFLSGLGADKRAFKEIKLLDRFHIFHVEWPRPAEKETIQQYSTRIASQINCSGDFTIIGFSFGGMVTIELLRLLNPKHAILISSVASSHEMPGVLKLLGKLKLDKLMPSRGLNRVYPFSHKFTGLKNREHQQLWAQIIRDSDPYFLKWAIHEVVNWTSQNRPTNIFHIHGSEDKTFPVKLVKADQIIEGGGHYMVLSHGKQISDIINKRLTGN